MKKMVKVAALAAMVLSVALTGCNGKKGEAAPQNTEASAESDSAAVSRKQIDAFFKDFEKLAKKMEKMAKKAKEMEKKGEKITPDALGAASLEKEAEELGAMYDVLRYSNEWNDSDETKLNEIINRMNRLAY